jgi:putative SOS response-associated peptidase YedK
MAGVASAASRPVCPINACLEAAAINRLLRATFASQRCLVPESRYYELETTRAASSPATSTPTDTSLQPASTPPAE